MGEQSEGVGTRHIHNLHSISCIGNAARTRNKVTMVNIVILVIGLEWILISSFAYLCFLIFYHEQTFPD